MSEKLKWFLVWIMAFLVMGGLVAFDYFRENTMATLPSGFAVDDPPIFMGKDAYKNERVAREISIIDQVNGIMREAFDENGLIWGRDRRDFEWAYKYETTEEFIEKNKDLLVSAGYKDGGQENVRWARFHALIASWIALEKERRGEISMHAGSNG